MTEGWQAERTYLGAMVGLVVVAFLAAGALGVYRPASENTPVGDEPAVSQDAGGTTAAASAGGGSSVDVMGGLLGTTGDASFAASSTSVDGGSSELGLGLLDGILGGVGVGGVSGTVGGVVSGATGTVSGVAGSLPVNPAVPTTAGTSDRVVDSILNSLLQSDSPDGHSPTGSLTGNLGF